MKTRLSPWWLLAGLIVVTAVIAALFARSSRQHNADRTMLKALLDQQIAVSARKLFNAEYLPQDGRLMAHSEIAKYLEDRKIAAGSLNPDLQLALKEKRATGILVSLEDSSDAQGKQALKLGRRAMMLLAWEQSLNSTGGMLWINGGGGETCATQYKCEHYAACCYPSSGMCLCVGLMKCPPCAPCVRCAPDTKISLK